MVENRLYEKFARYMRTYLLVEVDGVCHVVDVFQDLVEAELVFDDALLGWLHQGDANHLAIKIKVSLSFQACVQTAKPKYAQNNLEIRPRAIDQIVK